MDARTAARYMRRVSESYRQPTREPEPTPRQDDGELDGSALARRQKKRAAIEEQARVARVEIATRQARIGAAFVLVIGLVVFGLTAPTIGAGYAFRGSLRGLVMGPAMIAWATFTLFTGTGGAERLADAPTWIRAGQVVAPALGALVGLALSWV